MPRPWPLSLALPSFASYHLKGSLYRDNVTAKWVEVASDYEGIYDRLDVRPPKVILAMSITMPKEREFSAGLEAIPVILDTGFNRTLQISERHLDDWTSIAKHKLKVLDTTTIDGRAAKIYSANLWLHRTPYKSPSPWDYSNPLLLTAISRIYVVSASGADCWPRIPVLGLEAILKNNLHLSLDARKGSFDLTSKRCFKFHI